MPHPLKLFLTFSALCVMPVLILGWISYRGGLKNTESLLRKDLEDERSQLVRHYETLVGEREHELVALATGPLPSYVRRARSAETVASIDPSHGSSSSERGADAGYVAGLAITRLPAPSFYADIACFDADHRQLFLFQPSAAPTFRTKDFIPGLVEPEHNVWEAKIVEPYCSIVAHPMFGDVRRCTVPIFLTPEPNSTSTRGALVADIRLDQLFARTELGGFPSETQLTRRLIVMDAARKIVYHQNEALVHQLAETAIPGFGPIASAMTAGNDVGIGEYRSAEGETWVTAYGPVHPGLWLAVARNYSLATQGARRAGWLGIALSVLFGLGSAFLLTAYSQKKTQRIERVTESVAAIAGGDLDQRVEARSSDDMRLLADSVNVMTARLREQIARETETRQFDSFVKLSAMLTHDLKNAIEGLSLMVSNMERHFDNPAFRVDAMKSLTAATNKLRAFVTRLSRPVNTLSGEFKMPRPTDLLPIIKRVLARTVESSGDGHQVEIKLPTSLFAMVEGERIEEVIENLVLNALEAMIGKNGKLTVVGGTSEGGRVFFSITDTGVGMSGAFIEQRLFRPFATQKTNGVGLGLYTCREVVRANGGTIEVESIEGSGTTFRVVLASAQVGGDE